MAAARGMMAAIAIGVLVGCGGGGAGGSGGGLPTCAIATRPNDPVGTDPMCNTVAYGGDWVVPEMVVATDGGIALDGGATEEPLGGTILDGDYNLVRFRQNVSQSPFRRTLRLFDQGTFFEWLNATEMPNADGGMTELRFNTSQQPSHPDLFMLTITCAASGLSAAARYGYTAVGNDLVLFAYLDGGITIVYTYRRTCAR